MKIQLPLISASLVAASLFAAVAAAQQQTAVVNGAPVLGYAFDRVSHSLRPIWGVPGAATVGESLDLGFSVKDAAVSSEQGYALASDGSTARLIRWNNSTSVLNLPVVGTPIALFLSPHGTAAAVLTAGWIGIVTEMGGASPHVAGLPLSTQPVAAAVSDDGAYILTALQDSSLVLLGRDGTQTSLAAPGPVSKVAFRPGTTDALAASPDNRVWLIQQTSAAAHFTVIATGADGVSSPVGLGFLPDGNHAVIANAGTRTVLTADVTTGARASVSCSCTPVQLERLAIPGMFRLTEALREPQYVFNATTGQTFFVPALPQERKTERRASN